MNTVSALANMNQDTTEITETATKIRRHGRSVERSSLTFPSPDSEWSLKDAHSLNPGVCHATIYHYVGYLQTLLLRLNLMQRQLYY